MSRTRFEARGRILCAEMNGEQRFVNRFTNVLIDGERELDGETVYRLDDGATVVVVAEDLYCVVENGMELRRISNQS